MFVGSLSRGGDLPWQLLRPLVARSVHWKGKRDPRLLSPVWPSVAGVSGERGQCANALEGLHAQFWSVLYPRGLHAPCKGKAWLR